MSPTGDRRLACQNQRVTSTLPPDHRANNFDVLRLIAAVLVVLTHSFAVVGLAEPAAVLNPAGGTWGGVGVLVFFSISGYLIAQSWHRDPSPGRYLLRRSSRIFPALAVMTVVTAAVLGPLTTDVSLRAYASDPNTWLYPIVKTLLFVPGDVDPPGIFAGLPYDGVNPSLWTLPVEFACYTLLMVVLLLRLPPLWATGMLTLGAAALSVPALWAWTPLGAVIGSALFGQVILVVGTFFGGALLFHLRDRVRLHPVGALVGAAAIVVAGLVPGGVALTPLLYPYVVLSIALAVPVLPLRWLRGWDLSYAIYLYGFPIQQLVVHLTGTDSPWVVLGLAMLLLAPIAALSWNLVEAPALRWARGRLARRHEVSSDATVRPAG